MPKNIFWIGGGVAAVAVLGFVYYTISPLFRTVTVDETIPQSTQQVIKLEEEEKNAGEQSDITAQPKSETPAAAVTRAEVVGTVGHPASGTARIVSVDGKNYVRYENFKTINGPDLYVYLAKDLKAQDFVSLGLLKATEGNINYEIPEGIDSAEYPYALVWCKAFGVLFNYADLSKTQQ